MVVNGRNLFAKLVLVTSKGKTAKISDSTRLQKVTIKHI